MRRGIKIAALLPVLSLSWRAQQFAASPLDGLPSLFQHQKSANILAITHTMLFACDEGEALGGEAAQEPTRDGRQVTG